MIASIDGEVLETSSNSSKTFILDLSLFMNANFSIFTIKNYRKIIYFFELELGAIITNLAVLNEIWFYK